MSDNTRIEWAEATWNWATGCTKITPGCRNCYAQRVSKRLQGRFGYPADDPFRVTVHHTAMLQPIFWRKPKRIFVCSMSDPFHKEIPTKVRDEAWGVMTREASRHIYLMLTKRPNLAYNYFHGWSLNGVMPGNVWLGSSAEDQIRLDERGWVLKETPTRHRFLSLEPLLGPVDVLPFLHDHPRLEAIRWVIVGGESGPGARPMEEDWVRKILQDCRKARVPCFIKQMGTVWARGNEDGRPTKGGDWKYWPESLRVRQYPDWAAL